MRDMKRLRYGVPAILFAYSGILFAAELLTVPQHLWDSLQPEQKTLLSERFVINVMAGSTYGIILDAQTLNESTPGTNAGSRLGAAYGSSMYVDRAFSGSPQNWNYSATNNLTAGLVGGIIGSLADKPAQALFRTRYTIKNGNGEVNYVEEGKANAFRHSVGLCMALAPLRPIGLDTCGMTREQFLAKHNLLAKSPPPPVVRTDEPSKAQAKHDNSEAGLSPTSSAVASPDASVVRGEMVRCKFGLASPVRVSRATCEDAGGAVLP